MSITEQNCKELRTMEDLRLLERVADAWLHSHMRLEQASGDSTTWHEALSDRLSLPGVSPLGEHVLDAYQETDIPPMGRDEFAGPWMKKVGSVTITIKMEVDHG
jgi:hypothetical protein